MANSQTLLQMTVISMYVIILVSMINQTTTQSCNNGFKCQISGQCIDISLVCNGIPDCPDYEDEPNACSICFGQFTLWGGASIQAIVYKNKLNGYYFYPFKKQFALGTASGYALGKDYNDYSNFLIACSFQADSTIDVFFTRIFTLI
eukprot:132145_1